MTSPRSLEALAGLGRELARCATAGNRAGVADVLDVLLDELARPVCGARAPDRSGRTCDLEAGHAGDHWTYGGAGLTWAAGDEARR